MKNKIIQFENLQTKIDILKKNKKKNSSLPWGI